MVSRQIGKALAAVADAKPSDASIHRARKSIKKARALWRMLRYAFPPATYRQANTCLRDAGRPLGAARDAEILVIALDTALAGNGGLAGTRALKALRHALVLNGSAIKQAVMRESTGIELSRRELRSAQQRIKNRSIAARGWSVIGKGLRRTYAGGRHAYHRAHADRDAAHLHEWRKQVQYLHYQLAALMPLRRGRIGKLASATSELSERLGDDHDLAVLRTRILEQSGAFFSAAQQAQVLVMIDRERARLQNSAFRLGARIYEKKPAGFGARFGGYWHEWRRTRAKAKGV
ncbi:MAG TPA: CHAD domain-containing protein [Steroidobacteraceae bacterium]|jgi:CHAD domain-containing protein|nr:CHAD domain-containing protein [Steroidobacteraceae bacterium]